MNFTRIKAEVDVKLAEQLEYEDLTLEERLYEVEAARTDEYREVHKEAIAEWITNLETQLETLEKEKIHWCRLACGRPGILYDIMKIQPHKINAQEKYRIWLCDFILDAITELDNTIEE